MANPRAKWMGAGGAAVVVAIASLLGSNFEGTRHTAYPDPSGNGIWTICHGHTAGVKAGDTATDAQCRAYLQQEMGEAYATVQRCINAPLTIGQAAAFTDATYNVGPKIVCNSTLQWKANSGDVLGACGQLLRWVYANGRKLPGLVARRQAERDLCVEGLQ